MLFTGQRSHDWYPIQTNDVHGRFVREPTSFRHRIGNGLGFLPQAGRYVLYFAFPCPWSSMALIALQLKGLSHAIDVCAVDPRLSDRGWKFSGEMGSSLDKYNGARYLDEIYTLSDPSYKGRATVPVLWDRQQRTIVNNESADILRIFDTNFVAIARRDIDLRPLALEDAIERANQHLYSDLQKAVYQAGFARDQVAHEEAVHKVFATLDWMERRLARSHWLVGSQLTETDIRAFVTLSRFDLVYYSLFRCNLRPLTAYPAVHDYLSRLTNIRSFAASVRADHIKAGYYSFKTSRPDDNGFARPESPFLPSTPIAADTNAVPGG